MDGRIVKEDTVGRRTHFVALWTSCTAEISDEGRGSSSSWMRGESSHGSRATGVEGPSRGVGDGEREEPSLESDQVSRGRSGGLVECTVDASEDV